MLTLTTVVVMAGLSGCGISLDGGKDSPETSTGTETEGVDFSDNPQSHPESPGQPTQTIAKDGGTVTRDGASLTYTGPEGQFFINSDQSISVSFPDGTTCTGDASESLVAHSGSSGMLCEIDVYGDGEVRITVTDSSGEPLWHFRSTFKDFPPEIERVLPGGDAENFA